MLCPDCGTDTPAPFDHCHQCAAPLPIARASKDDQSGWIGRPAAAPTHPASRDTDTMLAAPAGPALEIGETFGRYRIIKLLGSGGMGQVYHAWDEELGEAVALKVIRSEFATSADADARFKRELSVARQVTHTNVVRIHDLGLVDGVRYISMAFIDGLDLATMLGGGRLPQDVLLSIARQLCAGLAAAHQAGVVHRDLKPANVMVDRSGHVFLMDFGLARSMEVTQFTQAGTIMGTVEYMSPEQAIGEPADRRSDIYTLGLILFEMFTGERPFTGETPMSRLAARLHKPAPDLRISHPDVPPYVARIVQRCLERDPALRYQAVEDIITDLDAHAAARRPHRIVPARLTRRHAAVLVLLFVLALGSYLAVGRWRSTASTSSSGAAAAAAPAVSLAIVPFQNASGDPSLDWLGPSLVEMLGTGIGQSSAVHTVSFGHLQQVLGDLRITADAPLDAATLRRVAEFTSADTVVSGRYVKAGDQVRIDATVQDFKKGRVAALAPVAVPAKDVMHAVDDLARSIQQALAVSPDVVKELRASAFKPSSVSAEAIRSYSDGLRLARQGSYAEAEKRFEDSTKRDPTFALGYSQLGLALGRLGRDDEAERASRRAVALSDTLPQRERYVILAIHARVLNDSRKAIDAYENLAKVSPDDPDVQFTLAGLYESAGVLDRAHDLYARLLSRDPKHVEALLAAGRVEIKRGVPLAGVEYLNRGLSVAIQVDNDEEKGRILQAIGIAYQRLNKPEEALRYYQEALDVRRQVGQKGGIAASLSQIADAERILGRPREALASYHEALQLQREIGDKRSTATTLLNLASFLADSGRYDESLPLFKESLQMHRDLNDEAGQAMCLNNIGTVYLSDAQYADALTYFQQALQLRERLKVPGDIAETLHNVAESSVRMGQYDEALSQYLRALELYRGAGNKQGIAIESYATGKIFEAQGRYGAAVLAKQQALDVLRATGERSYWMVNVLGGYGEALSLVGRSQDADTNLGEALRLARELNNEALVAQTLNYQGDRLFYMGEYGKARGFYEQALRIASRTTDREQILTSRFNLARLAVKDGNAGARALLKAVAAEADTRGLRRVSAECSVYLGEALLRRAAFAPARAELESAIARSEKLGVAQSFAPARYLLAQALTGLKQNADASRELLEARRLVEAIHKEAGTDAILARSDLAPIIAR